MHIIIYLYYIYLGLSDRAVMIFDNQLLASPITVRSYPNRDQINYTCEEAVQLSCISRSTQVYV